MSKRAIFFLKLTAALAVFAVVLIVAGGIALKKYLPPEKVRALILENAQKALKREVRVDNVNLDVLNGLTVSGLELSESPDFKAGTFAQAKSFQLRVQLLPLLHKKVVVDKISVDGLRVTVVKGADGKFNFSDISNSQASAPAAAAGAAPKAAGFDLDVRRFALSDAQIVYRDRGTGDEVTLSELGADLNDFTLKEPFTADLALKASGHYAKKLVAAAVQFSGTVDPAGMNVEKMGVTMKKFMLEAPEGKLKASGTISGTRDVRLDVKAEATPTGLDTISLEASGTLSDIASKSPGAALSIKAKTPKINTSDLKFAGVPAGLSLPPADVETKFDLQGDDLSLKSLALKTKGAQVDASGALHKIRSAAPQAEMTVAAKLEVPALKSADLAFLRAFKVKVPEDLSLPGASIEANVSVSGDDVAIKSFHLKSSGTDVTLSGAAKKARSAKPDLDLDVAAKLDWPELHSSDVAFLRAYGVQVPQDVTVPPFQLDAQLHYGADRVQVKAARLRTKGVSLDVAGSVAGLSSKKPAPNLTVAAKVDLPAIGAKDLSVLKLASVKIPEKIALPASKLDAQISLEGEDVGVKAFRLRASGISIDAAGSVKNARTAPVPELSVAADLDLPAFTSKDVEFLPGVPPDLSIPASRLRAQVSGGSDAAEIKSLRLNVGSNDIELDGKLSRLRSKSPSFDLTIKCRKFVLGELTQLSAQTRQMKLAGSGLFALAVRGQLPKPELAGKMQFEGLGATVAGLELSGFGGTATFNDRRIDIPKLRGAVDGSPLAMNVSILDYTKVPDIQVEGDLGQFDVAKYFAAKAEAEKAAPAAAAAPASEGQKSALRLNSRRSSFTVHKLIHNSVTANDASLNWNLTGITPALSELNGDAGLSIGGGQFHNIAEIGIVKFFEGLGIFPHISNTMFRSIQGKGSLTDGSFKVESFEIKSDAFDLYDTEGTIDLPSQKLKLLTTIHVGNIAPVYVNVGGTLSHPSGGLGAGRYLKNTVENAIKSPESVKEIIQDPSKLLKGLLGH